MVLKRKHIIYFFLMIAYFQAVLRVSPDSNITLFRLLIPVGLWVIGKTSAKYLFLIFKAMGVISCLALIQYILTKTIFYPEVYTLTFLHEIEYLFHIFSMAIVIAFVACLKKINGKNFLDEFSRFCIVVVKLSVIFFLLYVLAGNSSEQFLLFGNVNDFGCILTIGIALLLFCETNNRIVKTIWIGIILYILLYCDAKLGLFAGIIEIGLFFVNRIATSSDNRYRKILKISIIFIAIIALIFFVNSAVVINGYGIKDITIEPLKNIVKGNFYSHSSTSISYRANVIMGLLQIIRKTFAIGAGVGNSSLILKFIVPDTYGTFWNYTYMASHIWWLEVMSDFGVLIILPALLGYFSVIRAFFSSINSKAKLLAELILISFPIWCMSSSGLYIEYFSISVLACMIMVFRMEKNKDSKNLEV